MKIYRTSSEKVIEAYHGTSKPFERFDRDKATQGVFWFSDDIEEIKNEESGANSNRYIARVELSVDRVAGWEEYDKQFLSQLFEEGYDSIHLGSNWVIFSSNRIRIIEWYRRMEDGSYELV